MKISFIRLILFTVCVVTFANAVNAQQRTRKKRPAKSSSSSAYGNDNSANNSTTPTQSSSSAYGTNAGTTSAGVSNARLDTLPIEVVKSSSNGLTDSAKPSMRPDAGYERNFIKDKTPLPYEHIREDDAVYTVRVWREIDTREKLNLPFRYSAEEDDGNQRFISILLRAVKAGDITPFSGEDDRFTTPITADAAMSGFGGGNDTVNKIDRDQNIIGRQVRARPVDPDSIYKFRLKEEWIFDKATSRLYVRILGIAPVVSQKLSDGSVLPNSEHAVFWVYYPDLRPTLAKEEVYNPKNYGARMSWEELFEARMFSSYIIKSSMDNPFDRNLATMYPNNTLFRLLEGEKIKNKIFDYEQSLWSY